VIVRVIIYGHKGSLFDVESNISNLIPVVNVQRSWISTLHKWTTVT